MGKVTATRPPDHFDIRIRLFFTVMLILPQDFPAHRRYGQQESPSFRHHQRPRWPVRQSRQTPAARRQHASDCHRWSNDKRNPNRRPVYPICPNITAQRHQHPVFLFTILLALNSPASHEHCAIRRHQFSEFDYLRFRYASNFRPPGRALRSIIALTCQILFNSGYPVVCTRNTLSCLPCVIRVCAIPNISAT